MRNQRFMFISDEETIQFLEKVTAEELKKIMDTPVFMGSVLEAAARSQIVSDKIDQVLKAEFAEMSPEHRERLSALARKLALQHARGEL